MIRRQGRVAWVLAACAAVVVQAGPLAFCGACDGPCCATLATGCGSSTADSAVDNGGCPLCGAASGPPSADSSDGPCRCQLESRNDRLLAPSRGGVGTNADDGPTHLVPVALPDVPRVLGVSREYLAAVLDVPIRPARILFGVWRN